MINYCRKITRSINIKQEKNGLHFYLIKNDLRREKTAVLVKACSVQKKKLFKICKNAMWTNIQ